MKIKKIIKNNNSNEKLVNDYFSSTKSYVV